MASMLADLQETEPATDIAGSGLQLWILSCLHGLRSVYSLLMPLQE